MARITVEDCLKKVDNRFTLIHMAAKRVRQLRKGAEQTIVSKNKDIVVSLREIVAGNVIKAEEKDQNRLLEADAALLQEPSAEEIESEDSGEEKMEEEKVAEGD